MPEANNSLEVLDESNIEHLGSLNLHEEDSLPQDIVVAEVAPEQITIPDEQLDAIDAPKSKHSFKSPRLELLVPVEGGRPVEKRVYVKDFAEKEPELRLLYAIAHCASYTQPDNQYKPELINIANKGLAKKDQIAPAEVDDLMKDLLKRGFTTNGGVRHKITNETAQFLLKEKGKTVETSTDTSDNTAEEDILIARSSVDADIIPPAPLPQKTKVFKKEHHQEERPHLVVDEKMLKTLKSTIKRLGNRQLEVLSAFELMGGKISNKEVTPTVKSLAKSNAGVDVYSKAYSSFKKAGYLSSEDGFMILTDKGRELIANIKTYYFNLDAESRKDESHGAFPEVIYAIADHIAASTSVDALIEDPNEQLPEHSPWLMSDGNQENIVNILSEFVETNVKNISRRLFSMRVDKEYIEVIRAGNEDGGPQAQMVTNVRLTRKGMQFIRQTRERLRSEENLLDQSDVEEAKEYLQACIYMAEQQGDRKLAERLKSEDDSKSLYEYTPEEFEKKVKFFKNKYNSLRKAYLK